LQHQDAITDIIAETEPLHIVGQKVLNAVLVAGRASTANQTWLENPSLQMIVKSLAHRWYSFQP
jgi:hypothetical protein